MPKQLRLIAILKEIEYGVYKERIRALSTIDGSR